jgi:hypothetical protein
MTALGMVIPSGEPIETAAFIRDEKDLADELSNDATDGLGCSTIMRTIASWTVVILISVGFGAFRGAVTPASRNSLWSERGCEFASAGIH